MAMSIWAVFWLVVWVLFILIGDFGCVTAFEETAALVITKRDAQYRNHGPSASDDSSETFSVPLRSGSTATPPVPRPSVLPAFAAPKTIFPPSYTTPANRKVPSYVPPARASFTPPLPPGYGNPFADKPTLRGSNSDGTLTGTGRQPIPPPPRSPPGRERIPLRPPDLANVGNNRERNGPTTERKKPLNTINFNRSPDIPLNELDHTSPKIRPVNETEYDLPILHYSSVSRILSGSSGHKQALPEILRRPDMFSKLEPEVSVPRTSKKDIPETLPKPEVEIPLTEKVLNTETKETEVNQLEIIAVEVPSETELITDTEKESTEKLPDPQPQPPKESEEPSVEVTDKSADTTQSGIQNKWLLAWDIHVYLTASLFAALALYSLVNIVRVNLCKRLLSRGYYIVLHGLLLTVGILRSVYLFYDAYNRSKSFPIPVLNLLLNIVFPFITSAFIILFLFLLQATRVNMLSARIQRPAFAAVFVVLHVVLCVTLDLASGMAPDTKFLPLICQCLFIVICICLGLAYLYMYQHLSKAANRKQDNVFGNAFTNIHRPTLATAIRGTLATALLSLLMAAVQLYGIFGMYESLVLGDSAHPWMWWGYQFCVRIIEIVMCFLMSWAGIQPLNHANGEEEKESQSSGFALFRCGQCSNNQQNSDNADDIYPAVCVTNQAIHDYTIRTGKKVYDDSFPLNNLHTSFPLSDPSMNLSTTERKSLRKSPYPPSDSPFLPSDICSTSERRSMRKNGPYDRERSDYDSPFSNGNELRHSVNKHNTSLNSERSEHSYQVNNVGERRSSKYPGMGEPPYSECEVRRSLRKSGTLSSLGSDRRHQPPQHRGGTQTLAPMRERTSPSMLVAENGFVRFRAIVDPGEDQETDGDIVGR